MTYTKIWRLCSFLLAAFAVDVSSAWAADSAVSKTACEDVKTLPFIAYGVAVPDGWSCAELKAKGATTLYVMEKDSKSIIVSQESIPDPSMEKSKHLPYSDAKEPLKTVRLIFESFLYDGSVVNLSATLKHLADQNKGHPAGVLFNKNRSKAVSFLDVGETERKGKRVSAQTALIYQMDQSTHFLYATSFGCTPDEFFSLVINPVIQK